MKVLLFDPPYERLMGIKTTPIYPIGLGYLSSVLNKAGHESHYINLDFDLTLPYSNPFSRVANIRNYERYIAETGDDSNHPAWNELREFIKSSSPNVVAISCISLKMRSALKMTGIIKKCDKNITVILGGHHPQLFAHEILKSCSHVDIIVKGEGEYTLLDVVEALEKNNDFLDEKLSNIQGIYFRNFKNSIVETESRALISNLDNLPFPDSAKYIRNSSLELIPLTALMASRGCPYKCNYCATNNIWQRKMRMRSVEEFISEIEHRVKNQHDYYYTFFDDCFTLNKKWIGEFCDKLIKDKLHINWSCISSVNLVDENVFKKMVQAGCTKINLAVESGSERILKEANKKVDLDYVRYIFKYARRYNISTAAYFMLGFPTETVEDIRKTQNIIKELKPNWAYVNVLIPLPGTEYYKWTVDNNLINAELAWSGDIYKHLQVNYTGTIEDELFNELIDETFELSFKINRKISNVWRRIPVREYIYNPGKIISDVGKFTSWLKRK